MLVGIVIKKKEINTPCSTYQIIVKTRDSIRQEEMASHIINEVIIDCFHFSVDSIDSGRRTSSLFIEMLPSYRVY